MIVRINELQIGDQFIMLGYVYKVTGIEGDRIKFVSDCGRKLHCYSKNSRKLVELINKPLPDRMPGKV